MSIPAPEGRQQWVLNLTDNQALQKAGVFSKSYWPKHFEKNFGYLLSTLETKLFGIVQARGAGGRVKPGVEPKAEPQVRFGAPSSETGGSHWLSPTSWALIALLPLSWGLRPRLYAAACSAGSKQRIYNTKYQTT